MKTYSPSTINSLKINKDFLFFSLLYLVMSLVMLNGIKGYESDFATYTMSVEFGRWENFKNSEILSKITFIVLSFFGSAKVMVSLISVFIYVSVIYLLKKIAFQYLQQSQYIHLLLIIALAFSFPVLSLSQSILRQGLAIVIMLLLLGSSKQLSLGFKLLVFLVAFLFHNSLAVFLPLIFIRKDTHTKLINLCKFFMFTFIYLVTINIFLISDIKKIDSLDSIKVSIFSFLLSIFALYVLSLNNFKNSWIPFLYLNSLVIIIVNYELINVDRFLYLPWIFSPILMFKFLNNNILITLFTIIWVSLNIMYQPTRFY